MIKTAGVQKQTLCNSGTISSDKTSFNKNSRFSVWNVIQTQLHNNLNIMKFGEENNTNKNQFCLKLVDIFCSHWSIGYTEDRNIVFSNGYQLYLTPRMYF